MTRFASYCLLVMFMACIENVSAQGTSKPEDPAAAYTKVITDRAAKIVTPLSIPDKQKADRVTGIIVQQYRTLNSFHDARNARIKEVKTTQAGNKALADSILKKEAAESTSKLAKIHENYLAQLRKELNPQQIEQVKDGMTYGVLPLTYKGYQDMIPNLTAAQKEKILRNLQEARELAMDAESSDAKHAWFGKYKGRINNLLAAEGYDLKKEGEEWQKRIQAAKGN